MYRRPSIQAIAQVSETEAKTFGIGGTKGAA